MPNGFTPSNQFEQYSYDKFETITETLRKLPCQKDGFDLPDRVTKLELESKWYRKILAGVWAITGGLIVAGAKYLFSGGQTPH